MKSGKPMRNFSSCPLRIVMTNSKREEYLQELTQDIEVQRAEIKQKVADKVELEESVNQTYGLMHALLGREVMNVFDHYK